MAIGLMKLNDALLAAGAPEDKARAAAEEVATYETRLAAVEARLTLLTWMVGTVIVLIVGGFGLMLRLLLSVPGVHL